MLFKLFTLNENNRRKCLSKKDVTLDKALEWLEDDLTAVNDEEGQVFFTKEELEEKYAESIRPEPRVEYNSFFTGGTEISEDSDRELFETDSDRTESSTECDN
jgi:hypothetical protein